MPAQWTAEIIGEMHLNHITAKQLSTQLGYHPKYVILIPIRNTPTEPRQPCCTVDAALLAGMFLIGISMSFVLNGHRDSKKAEQTFRKALHMLICQQKN